VDDDDEAEEDMDWGVKDEYGTNGDETIEREKRLGGEIFQGEAFMDTENKGDVSGTVGKILDKVGV
jgi:hypothetical protein